MTPSEQIPRLYYPIKDVASALACSPSLIRFYENRFGVRTHRNRMGERRYTVTEIGQMAIIVRLARHLNLDTARKVYKRGDAERVLEILEPQISEPVGYLMRMG